MTLRPYELTVSKAATVAYLSAWALWTDTIRSVPGQDHGHAFDHMIEAEAYDRAQEIRYGLDLLPVEADRWPWRIRYERVVAPEDGWPMHAGQDPCDCMIWRDPYCGTRACAGLPLVSCPT